MPLRSLLTVALIAGVLFASDAGLAANAPTPVSQQAADAVAAKLKAVRPDLAVDKAEPAAIPGMVALELHGGTVLYASADGRYVIAGDLYELGDQLVNINEAQRDAKRKDLMANVALTDMAVFPAQGERKAVIAVFTDVDCPYCRKLHQEVPKLNQMGVEVRYLAYPRGGIGSPGYDKLVTAWCSTDRRDAITRLKRGEQVPNKTCKNPVAQEYELGHAVGLEGTPAIVLEDGRMLPGYMSAEELSQVLGI